ncbi:ZIP family metal transporter [Candidatus Nitrosocosmicus hydrocola]|uniref:ZIP family metal transporter n=1 Tax=Candidatus Nitrosocosmicus hydrocola TaxID=1826872 RepID=UPI0011E5F298|nr:ZIP family metal transporter [Candidatus Nitrosocosmicus hydrocola]
MTRKIKNISSEEKKDITDDKNNTAKSSDHTLKHNTESKDSSIQTPAVEKINLQGSKKDMDNIVTPADAKKKKFLSIGLALVPLVVLAAMIYFLTSPFGQDLITGGTPLPEITIEKIEFHENQIVAYIRNTGQETVTISQADINDRIHSAAIEPSQVLPRLGDAKVIIPFFWNTAEPYEVGITTSDGTRFSNTVEAAAPAPVPNINQVSIFALLGVFVGVIPVLIGLAWYPFMKKITRNQYNFFLSLTAGLLIFLGIEAFLESNEIAAASLATVFNGQMLIPVVIIATFLGLFFLSEYFIKRAESKGSSIKSDLNKSITRSNSLDQGHDGGRPLFGTMKGSNYLHENKNTLLPTTQRSEVNSNISENLDNSNSSSSSSSSTNLNTNRNILKPLAISLMVAIGIGLHNFGEGLAIGAAVLLGEIALSTFLIIGFTIHNTTEGLAIVAPLAKSGKLRIRRLVMLGLIAGIPTILGTWIGGFIYSPLASVIFLAIGAGAIFQVVYSLIVWMSKSFKQSTSKQTTFSSANDVQNSGTLQTNTKVLEESNANNSGLSIVAGFILGMLIMYLTGLFV